VVSDVAYVRVNSYNVFRMKQPGLQSGKPGFDCQVLSLVRTSLAVGWFFADPVATPLYRWFGIRVSDAPKHLAMLVGVLIPMCSTTSQMNQSLPGR
jgi:hypothetical protein